MRLLVSLISLLITGLAFGQASDSSFDFSTDRGRIEYLRALTDRHPEIHRSNLEFRRNPLTALSQFSDVSSKISSAKPVWTSTSLRAAAAYSSSAVIYDHAAMNTLQQTLASDLEVVHQTRTSLAGDIEELMRVRPFDEKKFRKESLRLLRLAPLLYKVSGAANLRSLDEISQEIDDLKPGQIDNLYNDFYKNHLRKTVLESAIPNQISSSLINTFEKEFIQKVVSPALVKRDAQGGQVRVREISIESVPPAVALFRGAFGGDCSVLSVPNYVLEPGVEVYFIRKSKDFKVSPSGYLLVATAVVDGKPLPYVITANGVTLTSDDARLAIDLVMKAKGATEFITPDFSRAAMVVNTSAMADALTTEHRVRKAVRLPDDWAKYASHEPGYDDYYERRLLENAFVNKLTDLALPSVEKFSEETGPVAYHRTTRTVTPAENALFALNLLEGGDRNDDQSLAKLVAETLQIKRSQIELMRVLLDSPSLALFKKAQTDIGLSILDLRAVDPVRRFKVLAVVTPEFSLDPVWQKMIQSTMTSLEKSYLADIYDEADAGGGDADEGNFKADQKAIIEFISFKGLLPESLRSQSPKLVQLASNFEAVDQYRKTRGVGGATRKLLYSRGEHFAAFIPYLGLKDLTLGGLMTPAKDWFERAVWRAYFRDTRPSPSRFATIEPLYRAMMASPLTRDLARKFRLELKTATEDDPATTLIDLMDAIPELQKDPDWVRRLAASLDQVRGKRRARLEIEDISKVINFGVFSKMLILDLVPIIETRSESRKESANLAVQLLSRFPARFAKLISDELQDAEISYDLLAKPNQKIVKSLLEFDRKENQKAIKAEEKASAKAAKAIARESQAPARVCRDLFSFPGH